MRLMFIINPEAGSAGNLSIERQIRRSFSDRDVHILHTQCPGHATELAREAAGNDADAVIAVGGDGTINEVLNGLIGSDVPMGVIPTGTANDLARHHSIPVDVEAACKIIRQKYVRRIDTVNVNGWHFLTVGGLGLPCDAISASMSIRQHALFGQALTRALGSGIYMLALLGAILRGNRGRQLQIHTGDNRLSSNALSVTLGNQPMLGRHFRVSPQAVTDDGLMDLCVIENKNLLRFLVTLSLILIGRHVRRRDVMTLQTRRAIIRTNEPVSFFGDGQFTAVADRFDVSVTPGAVSLLVPPGNGG